MIWSQFSWRTKLYTNLDFWKNGKQTNLKQTRMLHENEQLLCEPLQITTCFSSHSSPVLRLYKSWRLVRICQNVWRFAEFRIEAAYFREEFWYVSDLETSLFFGLKFKSLQVSTNFHESPTHQFWFILCRLLKLWDWKWFAETCEVFWRQTVGLHKSTQTQTLLKISTN